MPRTLHNRPRPISHPVLSPLSPASTPPRTAASSATTRPPGRCSRSWWRCGSHLPASWSCASWAPMPSASRCSSCSGAALKNATAGAVLGSLGYPQGDEGSRGQTTGPKTEIWGLLYALGNPPCEVDTFGGHCDSGQEENRSSGVSLGGGRKES